jgi:hypothetical protein
MKTKAELIATCQALRKNDPRHTKLDLTDYDVLLLDQKHVQQVVQALEENTVVEDLTLSRDLCADTALQLSHFLRSCPSLRRLGMTGDEGDIHMDEDSSEIQTLTTSIVIESISRSSSLVKLSLRNIVFGEHCHLEGFLSSTRTLLDFTYADNDSTMSYRTAQAFGRGLAKNKSLVKLQLTTPGLEFMAEILFGLFDHNKLKSLELVVALTESSGQVLRSLLHCNRTLDRFKLRLHESEEEFPTMASVLAGLANNTGLKEVLIDSQYSESDTTLATAWTDMLQRNTSIQILDLTTDNRCWHGDHDYILSSAVAEGLANNSTLETVRLPHEDGTNSDKPFNGPVWQEMLENNHSLKTLSFSQCCISVEGFECIARGLSCNISLETLDLSGTEMGESSVIALVDGLRINKTLKSLDLSQNDALSQSGRDAIARLLGYNVLRELNTFLTVDSIDAATLTYGLSNNRSIETLNVVAAFVDENASETFRALCETLHGNTTLRYLAIGSNKLADTGLLLLGEALTTNVSLEILDMDHNDFTHDGVSQFFGLLPQMNSLKVVYGLVTTRNDIVPTEALGLALVEGLRKNTKLQKIFRDGSIMTVNSSISLGVARKINFYLALNRCGRSLLRLPTRSEPPSGLWPRILAKISAPRDTSLLYYFLRNKPKMVNFKAAASRKRTISDQVRLQARAELDEARGLNAVEDAPTERFAVRQKKNDGSG